MSITNLEQFKKNKREAALKFSPDLMKWFNSLDDYRMERARELLDQYNFGEVSVSDLVWNIVTREAALIDAGDHALKLADEKYNPDKIDKFLMNIYSESVGNIDTTTKAYQNHVEKESD